MEYSGESVLRTYFPVLAPAIVPALFYLWFLLERICLTDLGATLLAAPHQRSFGGFVSVVVGEHDVIIVNVDNDADKRHIFHAAHYAIAD